ncbi:hypothetical protein [Salinirubrum litoreum]|uniref:Energy-coupling factor transport system substrate-specific component n=1 Tax=Salinirubrum litoreum TaxID=1126234 RepID=A0ABD5RBB1_9EURY|nr:hypothetical protein [Salinirubrum litoreum]
MAQWLRRADLGVLAGRAMQSVIAVILVVGLWERSIAVVVNASLALAITFLPALLRRDWDVHLGTGLTLWMTLAVLLHTVGMLGFYVSVSWWDHVTHTLSATVVASVGYATARAVDEYSDAIYLPSRFLFVYILLFTMAFGVLWEVLEFSARFVTDLVGVEAVLIQFSVEDTIVDLIFDFVGAVLVALFGTPRLQSLVTSLTERLDRVSTG